MTIHRVAMILLLVSSASAAQFSSREAAGFHFTSNANLESEDQDSDLFAKISSSNILRNGPSEWNARIQLQDYFSQHEQDQLSWKLKYQLLKPEFLQKSWDGYAAILGQHYLQGSPQNTESSFSYLSLQAGVEKRPIWKEMEFTLNPQVEFRSYLGFQGRFDSSAAFYAGLSKVLSPRVELSADAGLGFTISNLSEYSKTYFELGGIVSYLTAPALRLSLEQFFRVTSFPSRTVSTTTAISIRRRKTGTIASQDRESHFLSQTSAEASYDFSPSVTATGGIAYTSQSSRSGIEYFSVFESYINLNVVF
jgi:hypothetical protein